MPLCNLSETEIITHLSYRGRTFIRNEWELCEDNERIIKEASDEWRQISYSCMERLYIYKELNSSQIIL